MEIAKEDAENMEHEIYFSLKIEYNNKTKTFLCSSRVNQFLGVNNPEMMYCLVTPELYYRFHMHEFWDDFTEMTGEEWAKVATELLTNFN